MSALDLLRQETLGEYEILAELGRGGMATVYLAHDLALDRRVAIKVMSTDLVEEGVAERFRREARTAASLTHPHIIPIYAVRERPDLLYFVMKFIMGQSLDPILKSTGALPIPMVQLALAQAASALGYAHRRGVIHRDVKPANIMLDEDGWVVVTDFGIAKVTTATGLTMTGVTVGTPAYMSPEQCMGREVTGASDQYSLGVVAYQLITGQKPFNATTAMAMMYAHFNDAPQPLRDLRPDCPPELEAAVLRMLAKDPHDRWPTIDEAFGAVSAPTDEATRQHLATLALTSSNSAALAAQVSTPTSPVPPARRSSGRTVPLSPGPAPASGPARRFPGQGPARAAPTPPGWQASLAAAGQERLPTTTPAPAPGLSGRPRWVWLLLAVAASVAGLLLWRAVGFRGEPGARQVEGSLPLGQAGAGPAGGPVAAPATDSQPASRDTTGGAVAAAVAAPLPSATVAAVVLSPARLALEVGGTGRLRLELRGAAGAPLTGPGPAAKWTSSAPAVAAVDSTGVIRALSAGRSVITATAGGKSARVQVDVAPREERPAPVASIILSPATASLTVGETLTIGAVPRDAQGRVLPGRALAWSASGNAVRVSDDGEVTAVMPGRAEVRVEVEGRSAVVSITVAAVPVADLRITPAGDTLRPGQTVRLSAVPRDARGAPLADRPVTWGSSDSTVASVAGGVVAARRPGTARISASAEDRSASVVIAVVPPPPDPAVLRTEALEEIRRTLDAFEAAVNARSVSQLRRAYPGMSAADENRWRSLLESKSISRLVASIEPQGEPRVEEENAETRFRLSLQVTVPGNPASSSEVEYRALFQRVAGKWQLARLVQQ